MESKPESKLQDNHLQKESEQIPSPRIVFVGGDSAFLGMKIEKIVNEPVIFSTDQVALRGLLGRLERERTTLPKVAVVDSVSPKGAEELNRKGISLIVVNQNPKKDLNYLTPKDTQGTVKNEVITASPQDFKNPEVLITRVTEAVGRLRANPQV